MTEQIAVPRIAVGEHGWRVTFAGMGINLALGILYTWRVISKAVPEEWNWNETHKVLNRNPANEKMCWIEIAVALVPCSYGVRCVG